MYPKQACSRVVGRAEVAVSIRREPAQSFLTDLTAPAKPEMALEMRKGDMAFISAPSVQLITRKEGMGGGKEEKAELAGKH